MAFQLRRVLCSEEINSKCKDILERNGVEVVKDASLCKDKDRLITEIKKYDGLVIRFQTRVTAEVIDAAENLKVIGRAGTGVDNIDIPAATRKGIVVMNTPGGNALSTAELTCALILATARHVARANTSTCAGEWNNKKFMGNEVTGKMLAVVGLGRIGSIVAQKMQAFGMKVVAYDPIITKDMAAKYGVKWVPLEEMWPVADYISLHTPLTPQTQNMINDAVFAKCKKGVKIVNCARGGILNEESLMRALQSGKCGGAGLDAFNQEPPKNMELIRHPLVTSTPHIGASTHEAQVRVGEEIAQQFVAAMQGKSLTGALNAPALASALSPTTKPWVALGTALGRLMVLQQGKSNNGLQIAVKTKGASLTKAGSYLNAAVLAGVLGCKGSLQSNLVAAPALAKKLGVQIQTTHGGGSDSEQVSVTAGTVSFTGTVKANTPLLTHIGGAPLAKNITLNGAALTDKQILDKITGVIASRI